MEHDSLWNNALPNYLRHGLQVIRTEAVDE